MMDAVTVFPMKYKMGLFTGASFTEDYIWLINFSFTIPLGLIFISAYYFRTIHAFHILIEEGVLKKRICLSAMEKMVFRLSSKICGVLSFMIPFAGIVLVQCLNIEKLDGTEHRVWNLPGNHFGLVTLWYILIVSFLLASCFHIIYKSISISIVMKSLFGPNQDFYISPLHPDGCGGLASIGQLGKILSCIVFVVGLTVASATIARSQSGQELLSFNNALIGLFYVISSITIFFLPLLSVHHAMKKRKKQYLEQISKSFDNNFKETLQSVEQGNLCAIPVDILQIREIYKIVESCPVWPFDYESIKILVINITGPILVVLLEEMISRMLLR